MSLLVINTIDKNDNFCTASNLKACSKAPELQGLLIHSRWILGTV